MYKMMIPEQNLTIGVQKDFFNLFLFCLKKDFG